MTPQAALAFVEKHGVVLVSGRGAAPRLSEAVAGEPIRGSWWAHPESRQIFRVLQALHDSPDVVVCRLVDGKLSLVHRRLWPALVRLAPRLPPGRLARVRQVHTADGHHENQETAFPQWVPPAVLRQARELSEAQAAAALGPWLSA
ncbi:MAG TPA: hypothetical protein VFA75_09265 [Nevskia sp.]|nr:hypothetical protein [Nevskia sp.]